jgi:hypothetical protein
MHEAVILSRDEIATAIVNYIGLKKGSLFFPYRIEHTDIPLDIPDSVMFFLEFIPKGTREVTHNIGGI